MIGAVAREYRNHIERRFDGDGLSTFVAVAVVQVRPSRFRATRQIHFARAHTGFGDGRYQEIRPEQVFVGDVCSLVVTWKSKNRPRTSGWPLSCAAANNWRV